MLFKDLPTDWKPNMHSAGCYLVCGGEFLMLQRVEHKSQPLLWQLPGGKIEKDENELDGVIREVFEETGLQIPKEKFIFLKVVCGRYPGEYDFYYHMFKVELSEKPEIKISPNEHQAFDWFTIEKALSYPLLKDQDGAILSVKDILLNPLK